MQLLLDTHVMLWCLQGSRRLSTPTRARILTAREVYVSSVSIWELSIKVSAGKLDLDVDELVAELPNVGLHELHVSHRHALSVGHLPLIHRDPFDRMLIAQANCESMTLLTADRILASYSSLIELI